MKTKITLSIVFLIFYSALLGQTTIPGGDVYGNWTVMGSITMMLIRKSSRLCVRATL